MLLAMAWGVAPNLAAIAGELRARLDGGVLTGDGWSHKVTGAWRGRQVPHLLLAPRQRLRVAREHRRRRAAALAPRVPQGARRAGLDRARRPVRRPLLSPSVTE